MKTDTALRLARVVTPPHLRDRRFEEWQADIDGCSDLGISATSIARGALRLAVEARATSLLSLITRLLRRMWTPATGVLLGAVCAAGGIPVLTVVALALVLQGGVIAVSRRRSRIRQSLPRRVGATR